MALSAGAAFYELTENIEKVIEFIDNISKTSYEQAHVIEQSSDTVKLADQILTQDMALPSDSARSPVSRVLTQRKSVPPFDRLRGLTCSRPGRAGRNGLTYLKSVALGLILRAFSSCFFPGACG